MNSRWNLGRTHKRDINDPWSATSRQGDRITAANGAAQRLCGDRLSRVFALNFMERQIYLYSIIYLMRIRVVDAR